MKSANCLTPFFSQQRNWILFIKIENVPIQTLCEHFFFHFLAPSCVVAIHCICESIFTENKNSYSPYNVCLQLIYIYIYRYETWKYRTCKLFFIHTHIWYFRHSICIKGIQSINTWASFRSFFPNFSKMSFCKKSMEFENWWPIGDAILPESRQSPIQHPGTVHTRRQASAAHSLLTKWLFGATDFRRVRRLYGGWFTQDEYRWTHNEGSRKRSACSRTRLSYSWRFWLKRQKDQL